MSLVSSAREFMGVPFRHQGRNALGVDCLGLLVLAARKEGIELEDRKGYARTPDADKLRSECERQLTPVDIKDMRDGDILLMVFRRDPQHIAIKTDIGIIHSYSGSGAVVEHRLDDRWIKRIKAVYRL